MLSKVAFQKYTQPDCSKWIAIPSSADSITAFGFFAFDRNYRYLKCTVTSSTPALTDLIRHSLASQPRQTNDAFVLVQNAHVTAEKMQSIFDGLQRSVPKWWRTDFLRFDEQAYCAWDTNHYGYGYVYLLDFRQKELRAFQWSQQHNTAAETVKTFGK